jgi:hypothetical protein
MYRGKYRHFQATLGGTKQLREWINVVRQASVTAAKQRDETKLSNPPV